MPDVPTSWELSHLPPLSLADQAALIDLLQAWFDQRLWNPSIEQSTRPLWDYAERHGLGGAAGALAMAGKIGHAELSAQAQPRYFSNLLFHRKCEIVCRRLQTEAQRLRVPMAILKGPSLADAYGDPGVRAYADVDIFVGSREEAQALIQAIGCEHAHEAARGSIRDRFNESGRFHVWTQGWELEFCHRLSPPGDPLFDMLEAHADRILRIPDATTVWPVLDPAMHLVFLIQHMARHLCARLIWFLDLAVLARRHRNDLDMDWVATELDRLEMRNVAAAISQFCIRHIDPAFPRIEHGRSGWNSHFQQEMTSAPRIVHGHLSLFHHRGWRKYFAYTLSPARFFLITDPAAQRVWRHSRAGEWSAARLLYTIHCNSRLLDYALDKFIVLCYPIFLWLIAHIAIKK